MVIASLAHVPVVMRISASMQEHHAIGRHTQRSGHREAAYDDCCALIDEGVGVHQSGVGVRDVRVVCSDRGEPCGIEAITAICQRIGRRHRSEFRHQRPDHLLVLGMASSGMVAQGIFEHRIHVDRRARAMTILAIRPAPFGHAPGLHLAARVFIPIEFDPGAFSGLLGCQRLGAHHHCSRNLTPSDLLAQPVHRPLRHVAAGVGVDEALEA